MKNLEAYVEHKSKWNALFGDAPMTFPLTQNNVNSLAQSISSELSPENLHCDGEASASHVRGTLRMLNVVQKELDAYCLTNWLTTPVIDY